MHLPVCDIQARNYRKAVSAPLEPLEIPTWDALLIFIEILNLRILLSACTHNFHYLTQNIVDII